MYCLELFSIREENGATGKLNVALFAPDIARVNFSNFISQKKKKIYFQMVIIYD